MCLLHNPDTCDTGLKDIALCKEKLSRFYSDEYIRVWEWEV